MKKMKTTVPFTNPKSRFYFVASPDPRAQQAKKDLEKKYGAVSFNKASTIITLGGDGTLLNTLRKIALYRQKTSAPVKTIYGMNLGTLGAWMNAYQIDKLPDRINQAQAFVFKPLSVQIERENKTPIEEIAFNEVTMARLSTQVPKIEISIDSKVVDEIKGDTVICSTPQGSRAYYSAAGGTIIPMNTHLLGLQSVCAYKAEDNILKPYNFNQLVPDDVSVCFKNISFDPHRQVSVSCDRQTFKRVLSARMHQSNALSVLVMKEKQNMLY